MAPAARSSRAAVAATATTRPPKRRRAGIRTVISPEPTSRPTAVTRSRIATGATGTVRRDSRSSGSRLTNRTGNAARAAVSLRR